MKTEEQFREYTRVLDAAESQLKKAEDDIKNAEGRVKAARMGQETLANRCINYRDTLRAILDSDITMEQAKEMIRKRLENPD